MKKLLILIFSLTILNSCTNFYGDKKLGNGYYTWRDGLYCAIAYYPKGYNNGNGGVFILEKNIEKYAFDDNYIYTKCEEQDQSIYFKVKKVEFETNALDSIKRSIIISIDSIEFEKHIQNNKLKLYHLK